MSSDDTKQSLLSSPSMKVLLDVDILPARTTPSSNESSSQEFQLSVLPLPTTPDDETEGAEPASFDRMIEFHLDESEEGEKESKGKDTESTEEGKHAGVKLEARRPGAIRPSGGTEGKSKPAQPKVQLKKPLPVALTPRNPPKTASRPSPAGTFKPAINKKSADLQRPQTVSALLYADAQRRLNARTAEPMAPAKVQNTNKVSRRILEFAFKKDFEAAVRAVELAGETVSFPNFLSLLRQLSFLPSTSPANGKVAKNCWSSFTTETSLPLSEVYEFLSAIMNLSKYGGNWTEERARECHVRWYSLYCNRKAAGPKAIDPPVRTESVGRIVRTEDFLYAEKLKRSHQTSQRQSRLLEQAMAYLKSAPNSPPLKATDIKVQVWHPLQLSRPL